MGIFVSRKLKRKSSSSTPSLPRQTGAFLIIDEYVKKASDIVPTSVVLGHSRDCERDFFELEDVKYATQ